MKLTVFQSDKGDCLLVTGAGGAQILADGGMATSYQKHVAAKLAELERIDLVYLSHIDQDHISGILRMMDDAVAWRVHDFQLESGNEDHPEPESPRPPEVGAIWHNAFHEQLGKNTGPIEEMLAASAAVLFASEKPSLQLMAARHQELATSVNEAIRLSRRVGEGQLHIPLNPEFEGKLMFVRADAPEIDLGGMSVRVIGPFEEDLKKLRTEWNEWLRENRDTLREIRRQARADEDRLRTTELDRLIGSAIAQAEALGRRQNVTTPNLASLMLLVEENGISVLLTGDGHADDILKGLEHHGQLDDQSRLHVDVLKVQHHGSEHNLHKEFCRRVTADHYIFCGDGAHENPDLRVIEAIVQARLAEPGGRRFKFWFNNSKEAASKPDRQEHMKKVETLVRQLKQQSAGRMNSFFLRGSSFELQL